MSKNRKKMFWITLPYYLGIAADALWAVALLLPAVFGLLLGNPNFNPDAQVRLIMAIGGILMTGWTLLLIWEVRKPVDRRMVILLTAFPVVFGLFIIALLGFLNGNTSNIWILRKTKILYHVLLDHFLWPANWFIITIATAVVTLINPEFSRTSLGYTLPVLARIILTSSFIALVIMIIIDYRNRPKHLSRSKTRELLFPLEFILMPIAGFFLNALPAIISHTQLMLGKKMEYKVTEKL